MSSSSPPSALRRTPFFRFHAEAGARLIDFGGWELPVQYTGIIAEHKQVRESVGLFDVSHMGEVRLRGARALEAARYLVSNDLDVPPSNAQYTCLLNEHGGIVDDLIVYRIADDEVFICVNAANRAKDYAWMVDHNPFPGEVEVVQESDDWAQVAVQGRNAVATLARLVRLAGDEPLADLPAFGFRRADVAGVAGCIVARTGYTGEDGFEIFLPVDGAEVVWPAIVAAGEPYGLLPIGLGARDTLRLEAKLCLYGNDITDDTTPLEAGLAWTIGWNKPDFVGKGPLVRQKEERAVRRRLVGMFVEGRIARPHCKLLSEAGDVIGEVTSGTRSPSLERNIALGYVGRCFARPGTKIVVDVRGRAAAAEVHKGAFYKRPY